MAKSFTFTSPDNRSYTVEGPDGSTKEQAFGVLQQRLATTSEGIPRDETDPRTGEPMRAAPPPAPAEEPPNLLDRGVGALQAAQSMALGVPASLAGNVAGAAETVTKGDFGTPGAVRRGAERAQKVSEALTPTPASKSGRETLQGLSEAVERSGVMGINPAISLPALPRLRSDLRAGSAATKEAIEAAPGTVRGVAQGVKEVLNPEAQKKALAQKAQAMGIELRPDMLSDNKFVRILGEALDSVPLSGSKTEQRQIAFNRALGKMIGADAKAERLTPDVFDAAMTRSGEKIGEIGERTPIHLAPGEEGFDAALSKVVEEAGKFETADTARIVANYAKELRDKAQNGVIPGEAFRKINSAIGRRIRGTTDGDLKRALGDLQETMQDALERHARPEDIPALAEARKQYAIGSAIQDLVASSKNGDVSAAGLMQKVTATKDKKAAMARGRSGDLGDLARIGQAFIKEPKSSGTAERGLMYALLGGAAGGAAPMSSALGAIMLYGGANLYNRLGGRLTKRIIKEPAVAEVAEP